MARPSGTSEGQPCYTEADIAEINAEIVVVQAEAADLSAQLTVKQQEYTALNTELFFAQMNSCPQ